MTTIIGIAGGSGSGKSTVVRRLQVELGIEQTVVVAFDNYYYSLDHLDQAERDLVNFDHPNALETSLLKRHLVQLSTGSQAEIPEYCYVTHTRKATASKTAPNRYVLVEGVLLFADDELQNCFDLRVFVDASSEIRLHRRIERDTRQRGRSQASVRRQWNQTVSPMYEQFVEPHKNLADLVVTTDQDSDADLTKLIGSIRRLGDGSQQHEDASAN